MFYQRCVSCCVLFNGETQTFNLSRHKLVALSQIVKLDIASVHPVEQPGRQLVESLIARLSYFFEQLGVFTDVGPAFFFRKHCGNRLEIVIAHL